MIQTRFFISIKKQEKGLTNDMKDRVFTVAILGSGSRGLDTYANFMTKSGHFVIKAVCDVRQVRLGFAVEKYGVAKENCFLDEEEFLKEKRADVLVIATQDQDHVRQCIKALELGYDVLLEKPITPKKEECYQLLEAQKKYQHKVVVCHVLRYAPVYLHVAKLINEGVIGQLMDIHAIEQVSFWHIAHSFVRGNWRDSNETSPMILAKCCHDMDLLQFYANSKCKTVSSMGSLSFFKKENQPKDASDRCEKCKHIDTCPYSAKYVYVQRWKNANKPDTMWPQNVVCTDLPLTEEKIIRAYESNGYGRCVFACDNNVVDHQETNILFENGVTANLCMTGFTGSNGRIYKFHGTYGEIDLDEEHCEIVIKRFAKPNEVIPFKELPDVTGGHGGGDVGLVNAFYQSLLSNDNLCTTLESSIESHLMAFAAEESRLHDGEKIILHVK